MDAVSLAVAAAFGVVGSLIGQWILGIFDTEPEQQRPMPLGPPPALRGRRPRMLDILNYIEQFAAIPEPESRYIQMESPGCAVASFTFDDDEPRTFRIVSRDSFDTLDKVTVYEMATSGSAYVRQEVSHDRPRPFRRCGVDGSANST